MAVVGELSTVQFELVINKVIEEFPIVESLRRSRGSFGESGVRQRQPNGRMSRALIAVR